MRSFRELFGQGRRTVTLFELPGGGVKLEKQREKPGEENRMEIRVDRYDGDNKSSQPTFSRSSALCERGKVVRKSKSCSLVPLLFLTLQTAAASLSFASPHFLLSGIECFSQGIPKGVKVSTVMILRILPSPLHLVRGLVRLSREKEGGAWSVPVATITRFFRVSSIEDELEFPANR